MNADYQDFKHKKLTKENTVKKSIIPALNLIKAGFPLRSNNHKAKWEG